MEGRWWIYHGDCLEVLKRAPEAYFDSVVSDPPAGIGFMGVAWDTYGAGKGGQRSEDDWDWSGSKERPRTADATYRVIHKQGKAFRAMMTAVMKECYRVLKPGGHILIWAIPRTSHWTATAIEDAGFEVRDICHHHFGQGFPKSQDVGKFIDKLAGADRKVVRVEDRRSDYDGRVRQSAAINTNWRESEGRSDVRDVATRIVTAPVTQEAKSWDGWGTALKPATEHWILARKPLSESSIARNVLQHGTGALNIDGSRVGRASDDVPGWHKSGSYGRTGGYLGTDTFKIRDMPPEEVQERCGSKGRWPTNLLLSHSCHPVAKLVGNLPPALEETIRRYFHGYTRLRALRERDRSSAFPIEDGAEILQSGLQGEGVKDQAHTGERGDTVPPVWGDVSVLQVLDSGRPQEVLQSQMQGSVPQDPNGKHEPALREAPLPGVAGQDFGYSDAKGTENRPRTSSMEGRTLPPQRLRVGPHIDANPGATSTGEADDLRLVYSGAPDSHGNAVGKAAPSQGTRPSSQRGQTGQPARESHGDGMGSSLSATPTVGKGVGRVASGERRTEGESSPLEVLECDVPDFWVGLFVPTGEVITCADECAPDCPVAELDQQSGERPGCKSPSKARCKSIYRPEQGAMQPQGPIYGDSGGASRFFPTFRYFPKPSRGEREKGLDDLPDSTLNRVNPGGLENEPRFAPVQVKNNHPTVKGVALMRWLCRLITPPNGLVLDPFCGSGSTGVACMQEGFRFIGIEQDVHYVAIAEKRIAHYEPKEEQDGG